jgi:hypothetical protein
MSNNPYIGIYGSGSSSAQQQQYWQQAQQYITTTTSGAYAPIGQAAILPNPNLPPVKQPEEGLNKLLLLEEDV